MSLEGKIAELVTATNGLINTFIGKRQEIDKAVERAVATIPKNERIYYVDAISGLDSNTGERNSPFATIKKALDSTPVGGVCTVFLLTDYALRTGVGVNGRYLRLSGVTDGQARVKIIPGYYPSPNDESWIGRFGCGCGGVVEINNIDLALPSSTGVVPAPAKNHVTSFVSSAMDGGQAVVSLKLNNCNITAPDDFVGTLIGCPTSFLVLQCNGVNFPDSFGGKYIYQVAAQTDPAMLVNARTNLKKL